MDIARKNERTLRLIQDYYSKSESEWFVGFSGGKDSSALLKLLFQALVGLNDRPKPITVLYCDTGVEIPVIRNLVLNTQQTVEAEARSHNIPLRFHITLPPVKDRYFVKVIGRGYPPPSVLFRWCTDRLRISPVQRYIAETQAKSSVILLGVRKGESTARDETISKYSTGQKYVYTQRRYPNTHVFCPLIDYSVNDVWQTLSRISIPTAINSKRLRILYWQAGGECQIVQEHYMPPCANGRFGCWTCTVISRDRASESLVEFGYSELRPLLAFRDWLTSIRSEPKHRCKQRRNGANGLGPFTLEARKLILNRLLAAEHQSKLKLIEDEELAAIRSLWEEDMASGNYCE